MSVLADILVAILKIYISTWGRGGSVMVFGAFGVEGHWFEPQLGTLGKSFTRSCLYDMIWSAALRLNLTPVTTCYHPFILYL